jgi:hypothetical protein
MKLPSLTPRQWFYFALTWLTLAAAIFTFFLAVALTETATAKDKHVWITLVGTLVGTPIFVGWLSLRIFGVTDRIKNAFGIAACVLGVMLLVVICIAIKPGGMLYGARTIVYGSASGSPTQIAKTHAAWVDVSPAYVDTTRIGRATSTTTDSKGKSSTRSRAVAPILTAHGESDPSLIAAEEVALFICLSDRGDILEAARGNDGTISGRMHQADFLELQAMDNASVENRIEEPRCVVPGRGASVFWYVLWILIILAGATGGAALVVSVASERS